MNQIRRTLALAAVSCVLFALPAAAAQFHDEFHKTYPAAANISVSLSNINGSVEITAWDRNEVKLDAEKTADNQEKLNEAEIRVNSSESSIHIETHYPEHNQNNPATVKYAVHVPRGARLDKIELVNGSLEIQGVTGEVNGSSVNGSVTGRGLTGDATLSTVNGSVSSELAGNARRVKLSSVNGHVEFAMPKDANAHLTANTVSGSISSDFGLQIHKGWVGSDLDTTLGSGATRIELSNVNGSIKIHGGNTGI